MTLVAKLLSIGIISLGFSLLAQIAVPSAHAAVDTVSVFWADEFNHSHPQPVNISSAGLPLKYSVGGINPGTFTCTPDRESINKNSVTLKGSDGKTHPLYTVSFTAEAASQDYFHFRLSILLPYYELTQHTSYELTLDGGISDDLSTVRFKCSTQPGSFQYFYLPAGQHTLNFSTGSDTVNPSILELTELISLNSAVIAWQASEPVSLVIRYGRSPQNLDAAATAKKYGLWYVARLQDLAPGQTYTYQIEAKDQGGNRPLSNTTGTFSTWGISTITIADRTGHEVSVAWTTSVGTDSIIEYGTTPSLGLRSGSHELSKSHNIRLNNLKSSQKYYARISLTKGDATAVSRLFTFSTLDASGGFSPDVVVNPTFTSQFDLSDFNFKDFPPEDLQASNSAQQASGGAVLAATNSPLDSIAGNFASLTESYPWLVWLWIPIGLLLTLIVAVWLLWRHQKKVGTIHRKANEP